MALNISVSEIRKPKIFRMEREIGANYFGFRISETQKILTQTQNINTGNGKLMLTIWVLKFGHRNILHQVPLSVIIIFWVSEFRKSK